MWFLLPYVFLTLLSPYLFKWLAKVGGPTILGCSLIIYLGTSYLISRHGAQLLFHNMWIYNPFLVMHFMFNFLTGAVFARERWFEKIRDGVAERLSIRRSLIAVACVLVVVECVFRYNFAYAIGLIVCFQLMPIPSIIKWLLALLGKHSMNIWMIHTWLCYYLFPGFIYSFKNPILIFLVLTTTSFMVSVMVNFIINTIRKSKSFGVSSNRIISD